MASGDLGATAGRKWFQHSDLRLSWVVVGKIAKPPLLIPDSLPLPIRFDNGRIVFPAPSPVVGIPSPPFARTVLADLVVLGIGGNLLAVIIGAPSFLAL